MRWNRESAKSFKIIFIYTGAFINWIYKYKCKASLDSLIDKKNDMPNFVLGLMAIVVIVVAVVLIYAALN
jgi:hypothetical protein